jgi:tellurite resistance protein
MAESQILTVIRVWAAVAWADGVLAESEADALRRLIRTAELSPEERVAAVRLLEAEVKLPETYLDTISNEARRGVYRAACRIAIVDHVLHATERRMLDKLRGLLAIPDEAAAEIEHDIPELI